MSSPFKFLDAYTKEDKDIFFGRDNEIEELYQKVFGNKLLLICGVSGTGKTSLINCGLANKFEDSDWLPINIRRRNNITSSLKAGISKMAITTGEENRSIIKQLQSLYLDHFKPIYLIFDQFEEVFIFGDREERKEFIKVVKNIVDSDVQCRLLFVMREEYLAGAIEFEREIPTFLTNRIRIEKMTWQNAIHVIEEPCKVYGIEVEKGLAENILGKLSPESTEVELTYLQVLLDKMYHLAVEKNKDHPKFTKDLLAEVGDVSDLLGHFLEEQIGELEDPDTGLVLLKAFVSIQGTKKQIGEEEIADFTRTLGKPVGKEELTNLLQRFVNLRILKDKDESGRYELRHDSLATKIYEKITLVEKELLEIKDFLNNAYQNFERRKVYLNREDLKYVAPYEDKLFLNRQLEKFITDSKSIIEKSRRRRRNVVAAFTVMLLIIFAGFTIWAVRERKKAIDQKEIADIQREEAVKANQLANESMLKAEENEQKALLAKNEAEEAKSLAINAKNIAVKELYENIRTSWTISPTRMNVLYLGVDNPVEISASGISPDKLLPDIDNGTIKFIGIQEGIDSSFINTYIVRPAREGIASISLSGITNFGDKLYLGEKEFRVRKVPDPFPVILGRGSGAQISKNELLNAIRIEVKMPDWFEYDLQFAAVNFSLGVDIEGFYRTIKSPSAYITPEQKELIKMLKDESKVYLEDVLAVGPDGAVRNVGTIMYKIRDILTSGALQDTSISVIELIKTSKDLYDVLFYYESEEDWNNYINCAYNAMENFDYLNTSPWNDIFEDPELCYYISKTIYQHLPVDSLVPAYNLALKAVNNNARPEYYDNYARIVYKVSMPGAIEVEKKAILLANEQKLDDTGYKSFLAMLSDTSGSYYWYDRANFYKEKQIPDSAIYFAERAIIMNKDNSFIRRTLASDYCYLSYSLLLEKKYNDALRSAQLARKADETYEYVYTYLPLVYIFDNQFDQAEAVYNEWKDKPWTFDDSYSTFRELFILNLNDLEYNDVTHQDFEKVRELLEE